MFACFALFLLVPSGFASASDDLESAVALKFDSALSDTDIGITQGAVSPDGENVLLVGADGYAHRISATTPLERGADIELNTARQSTLRDVDWHPRGNTALMTGDDGVALRYDTYDHSVTSVNGSGTINGLDMTTVKWRTSGDYAYFGANDGSIWRFAEGEGMVRLDGTRTGPISDIDCLAAHNICVVVTQQNGIGVISRDHAITWLGNTEAVTWMAVDCADPYLTKCVAFGSGLKTQAINVNTGDSSWSSVDPIMELQSLDGDITDVSRAADGRTLIHLAPFATVKQNPNNDEAFAQLLPKDAASYDEIIAGRTIEFVWETKSAHGFMITSYGNVVEFEPAKNQVETGIMETLVFLAVGISVPGVLFGLVFMNSKTLQNKYYNWRRGKKSSE